MNHEFRRILTEQKKHIYVRIFFKKFVMYLISSGPDRVKLTKEGDLSFFNKIEEVGYKGLLASLCLLNVPIRKY